MPITEAIEFVVSGVTLRGSLVRPDVHDGPPPVVILQSGLGGPAESLMEQAGVFADAGLACLLYDHRCTGRSDGEPRQLFDPWQQCRDLRDVITHLTMRDDVDGQRIGLWGISIGGANALFTTAIDKRVKAVTALIPPVSGWSARGLQPEDTLAELEARIPADRQAQMRGEPAATIRLHGSPAPGDPVMFSDEEGIEFVENMIHHLPSFRNEITISTLDCLYEMEVRAYADRITVPTLMILASEDTVAPAGEAREMFASIPEPKELVEYPGQHYEILSNYFAEITVRSAKWMINTLSA